MKKADKDTMRDEYDFSAMAGGVRGKYVRRMRAGSNVVLLEPDVAKAFHGDQEVNDALRALLQVAASLPQMKTGGKKRAAPRKRAS